MLCDDVFEIIAQMLRLFVNSCSFFLLLFTPLSSSFSSPSLLARKRVPYLSPQTPSVSLRSIFRPWDVRIRLLFSKLAKIYCPNRGLVLSFHPLWSIACLACEYFCKCLILRFLWEKSDSQPNLYFYDLDYITMSLMVGFQNLNFEINHWISSFSKRHCLGRDKGFIPLTPLRGLSFPPLSLSLPSSHRLTLLEFILISTGRSRRNEISRRSRCLDFPLIVSVSISCH